jgi:hypothetical protein
MFRIFAAAATPWAWLPDDAATARGWRDRRQLVESTAELERSGPLQHFRLQENPGSGAFVERR